MDLSNLPNFLEDHQAKFHQLFIEYPTGQSPKDSTLQIVYDIIRQTRCCTVKNIRRMASQEFNYFNTSIFSSNCRNQLINRFTLRAL